MRKFILISLFSTIFIISCGNRTVKEVPVEDSTVVTIDSIEKDSITVDTLDSIVKGEV